MRDVKPDKAMNSIKEDAANSGKLLVGRRCGLALTVTVVVISKRIMLTMSMMIVKTSITDTLQSHEILHH